MDGLRSYMVRLGSLELATVIFWMLFWLANGLAKLIPGVHIGVKFAEKGNPFTGALDKMGLGHRTGRFRLLLHGCVRVDRRIDLPVGTDPVHHGQRFGSAAALDPARVVHKRDHLHGVYVPERCHGSPSDTVGLAHGVFRGSWRVMDRDRRPRRVGERFRRRRLSIA